MKVLLLSYAAIPAFAEAFGAKGSNSAGWVVGIHNSLIDAGCDVAIATPMNVQGDKKIIKNGTTYYAFPQNYKDVAVFNPEQVKTFKNILDDFKPDAVTIFGTEYTQGYAMLLACEKAGLLDKTVIFTQGLISMIQRYYVADVPRKIASHKTLRERFNKMDVESQQKAFENRGENEIKMLKKAKHIIGGTVWDKSVIKSINPDITYHYCPEILRGGFYEGKKWDLNTCEKHSVFSVQSSFYPVKGVHYLLEGMNEIVKKYPDAKLYVTLAKPRKAKSFMDKINIGTYEAYIAQLMDEYDLWDNVEFLGMLNEEQLIEQYLKANVFVCASSIENHSQTVSEAKILGVPVVASFVGGVVERIKHGEDGFHFQHNAPYMMAEYVGRIFEDEELALSLSDNAKINAKNLIDKKKNSERFVELCRELSKNINKGK